MIKKQKINIENISYEILIEFRWKIIKVCSWVPFFTFASIEKIMDQQIHIKKLRKITKSSWQAMKIQDWFWFHILFPRKNHGSLWNSWIYPWKLDEKLGKDSLLKKWKSEKYRESL